jgi:hypothetical protein
LKALRVDPKIAEREKLGLPAFACNLGLLEPTRSEALLSNTTDDYVNKPTTSETKPLEGTTDFSNMDFDFLEDKANNHAVLTDNKNGSNDLVSSEFSGGVCKRN